MNYFSHTPRHYAFVVALTCFLFISPITVAGQDTNTTCEDVLLTEGENDARLGLHDEVIESLTPCLPDLFLRPTQQDSAFRLVILAHYELEQFIEAEDLVKTLVKKNRRYNAPDNDVAWFQRKLDEHRPKPWHQRWAFRGPALGAAAVGAFLLIYDPPKDPLPFPPPAPANN